MNSLSVDAIAVLLIRKDGKVLLVQREMRDNDHSGWVFPAGIAEEDTVTGAVETAQYLLGVSPEVEPQAVRRTDHEATDTGATYVLVDTADDVDPADEILDYKWVSAHELEEKTDADIDQRVLDAVRTA